MAKKKKRKLAAPPSCELRTGDCLKLLSKLDDGSVDLVFADPPFGIDWPGYTVYDDSLKGPEYVAWCSKWLQEIYRILKPDGTFWLNIGDEYVSELDVTAKKCLFRKRSHVVHYFTFGVACPKNFARSHVHLLYYTKHKSKFTFNKDDKDLRVPSSRQLVYNDKRANPDGKLPDNTWVLSPVDLDKAFSKGEDTWLVSRVCGTFKERQQRGTYQKRKTVPQMPLEILNRIIVACSNPGELVVDPFGGTFTTAESAVRLGRNFWGCDISQVEVTAGRRRVKKFL